MCLNRNVVVALALVAAVVLVAAPGAFGATAPFIAMLACPLSMALVMRRMSADRSRCSTSARTARGREGEFKSRESEVAELRAEIEQLRAELSEERPVRGHADDRAQPAPIRRLEDARSPGGAPARGDHPGEFSPRAQRDLQPASEDSAGTIEQKLPTGAQPT